MPTPRKIVVLGSRFCICGADISHKRVNAVTCSKVCNGTKWRAENPEKVRASCNARYARNPLKGRAYSAKYRAANPEKVKAATDKWRAENPEWVKVYIAKWLAENPEKVKSYRAKNTLIIGLVNKLLKKEVPAIRRPDGRADQWATTSLRRRVARTLNYI
jgi:hypothetical protein